MLTVKYWDPVGWKSHRPQFCWIIAFYIYTLPLSLSLSPLPFTLLWANVDNRNNNMNPILIKVMMKPDEEEAELESKSVMRIFHIRLKYDDSGLQFDRVPIRSNSRLNQLIQWSQGYFSSAMGLPNKYYIKLGASINRKSLWNSRALRVEKGLTQRRSLKPIKQLG